MKEVEKIAKSCVHKIISELLDRKGIGDEWDCVDRDIKKEITKEWENIIIKELLSGDSYVHHNSATIGELQN